MIGEDYGDVWVCQDCYFAHHYGAHKEWHDVELVGHWIDSITTRAELWFAGEDCDPVGGWHEIRVNHSLDHNREPLGYLDGFEITDNTCSDHYYQQDPEEDDHGVLDPPCDQCGSTTWEDGLIDFDWRACDGCHSSLGGYRYRLHLWKQSEEVT